MFCTNCGNQPKEGACHVMKKLLVPALIAVLLLAGCKDETLQGGSANGSTPSEETSSVTEQTTQEQTQPQGSGVYFIKEQTYYDNDGNQLAKMTVTLNEDGMPQTVFMDSGADITYTPTYEGGDVTAFTMTRAVYGEETVNYVQVNDRGDTIKNISEQGTEDERTFLTAYAYDEQGRIVKEELSRDGKTYLLQLTAYDDQGNKTRYEEINYSSPEMSYVSVFTNTYEAGLLTEKECAVDGVHDLTTTYTYDSQGHLTEERTDNGWVTTYAYDDDGHLITKTITKGGKESNRYEYSYDENGNKAEEKVYNNGQLSGRFIYVWEEFASQPTDAQLKVFGQFGIL